MKRLSVCFEAKGGLAAEIRPAADLEHACVQGLLPGMSERRMAEIMGKRNCLRGLRPQAAFESRFFRQHILCYGTCNLRNFDAVRQACAIEIGLADAEYLRLTLKPPERRTVQYAITIALGRMPMILVGRRRLLVSSFQQELVHRPQIEGKELRSLRVNAPRSRTPLS